MKKVLLSLNTLKAEHRVSPFLKIIYEIVTRVFIPIFKVCGSVCACVYTPCIGMCVVCIYAYISDALKEGHQFPILQ